MLAEVECMPTIEKEGSIGTSRVYTKPRVGKSYQQNIRRTRESYIEHNRGVDYIDNDMTRVRRNRVPYKIIEHVNLAGRGGAMN